MNMILRRTLFFLSMIGFIISFSASYYCGNNLLVCFVRASITLFVIFFVVGGVIKMVFRDIALSISEFEEAKKKEQEQQKQSQESQQDANQFVESEEKIAGEIYNSMNGTNNKN